ncbi:hypothetical protein Lupro_04840 [Lutibacter profundi]|uniref:DUF4177 domain-containing protein n=1 Tax=Lutibacter profundi TaxID=1622118 RepID=A0A0X8G5S6_9FLAO|nr:DUF4177 domain-containing protein [Lutibacter profundi]AMC10606.1 hypothetical protein Lupro_04840 [Lutibacter profundi]
MKEYKIVKPESRWTTKDKTFEDLFNKYASQGWQIISISYAQSGNIQKAVLKEIKIDKLTIL